MGNLWRAMRNFGFVWLTCAVLTGIEQAVVGGNLIEHGFNAVSAALFIVMYWHEIHKREE